MARKGLTRFTHHGAITLAPAATVQNEYRWSTAFRYTWAVNIPEQWAFF
jgi:hypothetical protein